MGAVRSARQRLLAATATIAAAALLAGCGDDAPAVPKGTVVTGPGVRAVAPPFPAEFKNLARRIRLLGLPPVGAEKFHKHAQMRVFVDGLLVPVPAGIGLDNKRKVFSSLHTHESTGVLHQESDKPFTATIGDVFAIWGVTFGPGQIGSLRNGDGRELRVYVAGQRIADPAAHVIKPNDNIVVSFGKDDEGIDLLPDTTALKDANAGKGGCSTGGEKKKVTSCLVGK